MSTDNTEELGLSDRGVGAQAAGFAIVGCVSLAILQAFSGSDYWLYQWFEMAVTRLYWAFVVPLAALFDWGRIMFAKGKAVREAAKAAYLAKKVDQAKEEERRRIEAALTRHGVQLDKDAADEVFGDSRRS